MSVCAQGEEESASEEPGAPLREPYEPKSVSKVVRVLTVLAYLLSVSLAAILLSVYYVCVWKSPELPPLNGTGEGELAARRAGPDLGATNPPYHDVHGGSGSTVNDSLSSTTSSGITIETSDSSTSESTVSSSEAPLSTKSSSLSLPGNKTSGERADNSSVT
ncbi:putative transmembrane protein INAFM2 isoform X2 [Leguminivora glycinivorella]|uniref:putative transmembrane protein INAFM2 isoform X2 n=1 Tax=Leguminivora glycinivorella TaxID=1035111 RepID=UPI00200CF744|nr:putative transmembrane protein INAFM2 isoform X2 [Leguminivora glycinivorella]